MRFRSLAIRSFWISAAAASAAGCGYDWGQVQRYGSCNCELVIKVQGIFDPNALPQLQQLKWKDEPTPEDEGHPSLLQNYAFAKDVAAWNAEPDVVQSWQRDALALTSAEQASSDMLVSGSGQCQTIVGDAAYQLKANVLLESGHGKAGASLEFFDGDNCSSQSLTTLASPSVQNATIWREVSLFAIAPPNAKSVRVRFFMVKAPTEPAYTVLFDNAIFNAVGGSRNL